MGINAPKIAFVYDILPIFAVTTNKSKILEMAPISISFAEKNISAIIYNNKEKVEKYIQNIILQLITFQSYQDLKLVFLLDEEGNETNLVLDNFMIKDNDNLNDVVGWCHLI